MAELSEERERFEALVRTATEALQKIPSVAQDALFHKYYGRPFRPGNERSKEIESALKDGYVSISDERTGEFEANFDDPGVSAANREVENVAKFLADEASGDFIEWYEDNFGHPADLSNQRFWHGNFK